MHKQDPTLRTAIDNTIEDYRLVELIARLTKNGECPDCRHNNSDGPVTAHEFFDMSGDDAIDTLHALIDKARAITAKVPTPDYSQLVFDLLITQHGKTEEEAHTLLQNSAQTVASCERRQFTPEGCANLITGTVVTPQVERAQLLHGELSRRFSWLGTEESASGADTVQDIADWFEALEDQIQTREALNAPRAPRAGSVAEGVFKELIPRFPWLVSAGGLAPCSVTCDALSHQIRDWFDELQQEGAK